MKKNIGKKDRILRLSVALLLVVHAFTINSGIETGIACLALAGLLVLNVVFKRCAFYGLFKFTTCKS